MGFYVSLSYKQEQIGMCFTIIQVTREYPQGQEQSNYKENHSLINLFEAMVC